MNIRREIGDDLHKRNAGAIVVNAASAVGKMQKFSCVLFEVHTFDANGFVAGDFDVAVIADRVGFFVLADLIALRQIGIEIVFAMKKRTAADVAVERECGFEDEDDGGVVNDRQGAWESGADRADAGVDFAAERVRAAAEHFGFGEEFGMDLHAHAGDVIHSGWILAFWGGLEESGEVGVAVFFFPFPRGSPSVPTRRDERVGVLHRSRDAGIAEIIEPLTAHFIRGVSLLSGQG